MPPKDRALFGFWQASPGPSSPSRRPGGTRRAPAIPTVLQRLPATQIRELRGVLPHVSPDFRGIRPCILSERPTDCLPQEKLVRAERRSDAIVEEFQIRFFLESELSEDRGTPFPEVRRFCPL